jgi:hypothetical protein
VGIDVHNPYDIAQIERRAELIHVHIRWIVKPGRWRLLLRSLCKDLFRSEILTLRGIWVLSSGHGVLEVMNEVRSSLITVTRGDRPWSQENESSIGDVQVLAMSH